MNCVATHLLGEHQILHNYSNHHSGNSDQLRNLGLTVCCYTVYKRSTTTTGAQRKNTVKMDSKA